MSIAGACGDDAFSAGWASIMPHTVWLPGYEMPHCPTRPLLFGMFFTSQSIVS